MKQRGFSFNHRLNGVAEDRELLLAGPSALFAADNCAAVTRADKRRAVAEARERRVTEKRAELQAQAEASATRRAAAQAQREIAAADRHREEGERQAAQKAQRDARYVARKARVG